MIPNKFLKDKEVLVMGLGLLGGGVATTKWLVRHGARVSVTDLKNKAELAGPIKLLGKNARDVRFVLGCHRDVDFKSHDIIVVNPAVAKNNSYLKIARTAGAKIENELTLFLRFCKNPVIGITGTRGKTTVATWCYYFLKKKFPRVVLTGNTGGNALLKALDGLDGKSPVVAELSSFQLELLPVIKKSPHIAVITNIMRDHLNRHGTMKAYIRAKENIFRYQKKRDLFIGPKVIKGAQLGFKIPKSFSNTWGEHNVDNLQAASLAANYAGVSWSMIKKSLSKLPKIKFRQEVIFKSKHLSIINDTTSTMPEATTAAIKRFYNKESSIVLIGGGADKRLDFTNWASVVRKHVKPEHIILIEGSATVKMIESLPSVFRAHIKTYKNLKNCLGAALRMVKDLESAVILFSPGGTSFEKFTNEFERGERFNQIVKDFTRTSRR